MFSDNDDDKLLTEHVPGFPIFEEHTISFETFSSDERGVPTDDCFAKYPIYSDSIRRFYLMFNKEYAHKIASRNKKITICGDNCRYNGFVLERCGNYPKCITIDCNEYAMDYREDLCKFCAVPGTVEYDNMHRKCYTNKDKKN